MSKFANVPLYEQETVIQISRNGDTMNIYTSDLTMMTKLDKCVAKNPKDWKVNVKNDPDGSICAKEYTAPKKLVLFRAEPVVSHMTEEQKKAAAERLAAYQAKK